MRHALADWGKDYLKGLQGVRSLRAVLLVFESFCAFAWNAGSSKFGTTMPCSWFPVQIDGNGARQQEGCPGPNLQLAPFLSRDVARSEAGLLRVEERRSRIRMSSPLAWLNSCRGQT